MRCAIEIGIIGNWQSMNDDLREKEDEYECFVFCLKHQEIGKRELKNGGKARI